MQKQTNKQTNKQKSISKASLGAKYPNIKQLLSVFQKRKRKKQ